MLTHLVPSAWPLAYSPPPAEHREAERPLPGTQGGRSGARMEPAGAPELTFSITVLTRLLPWRCEWPGSVPPFVTCTTHTGVPRAPPTGRGPAARGSGPPASAFPTSPVQPAELGPTCTRGPCRGLSSAPPFSTGRQRGPVNAIGVARALWQLPSSCSLKLCSIVTFSGPGQGYSGPWVSVARALPERKPPEEGAWDCVLEGEPQSAWRRREARTRWGRESGWSAGGSGFRGVEG